MELYTGEMLDGIMHGGGRLSKFVMHVKYVEFKRTPRLGHFAYQWTKSKWPENFLLRYNPNSKNYGHHPMNKLD